MTLKSFQILIIALTFSACSSFDLQLNKTLPASKKREEIKAEKKEEVIVPKDSLATQLNEIIQLKNNELDSLYQKLQEQEFIIDSLEFMLEIANNRIAINQDFIIPDSIIFAGRKFDLKNERIFQKFKDIYEAELKVAYRFIPRSGKYFSYFDSIFTKYNVPLDARYLAIAESRLSPVAGSRVGAMGIWQFMPSTAKGYGMKINSFVDERRNVFLSTVAAAKYLNNAYTMLKKRGAEDWLLAMSAYNAGVGSIRRVIKQQKAHDFFDLVLRVDETNKYVWRAAAIKLIMENQKDIFGKEFELQKPILSENQLVKLTLKGHYKIDEWASAKGTSLGKVLELNPWIKIYQQSRKRYSAINNVVLPPGDYEILIPKGNNEDSKLLAKIEKQFLDKNAGFFTHHIVKKGDNLYNIARKYRTTISKIKNLNGLRSNVIYPGQKLKLYGANTPNYYVVKKGETVGEIADKLGVSSRHIISKNNLNNNGGIVIIQPGQKLYY